MKHNQLYLMVLSAILIAIGIIIPLLSPVKIILEPASFTLASHVPIFIAMFISPGAAVAVSLGTTLGFLLASYPIVIVARAGVHVIFALVGSLMLKRKPVLLDQTLPLLTFAFLISIIHGVSELLVVTPFYFSGLSRQTGGTGSGFFKSVVLLVGVGSIIHSMIDFYIARAVWVPLAKIHQRQLS